MSLHEKIVSAENALDAADDAVGKVDVVTADAHKAIGVANSALEHADDALETAHRVAPKIAVVVAVVGLGVTTYLIVRKVRARRARQA